MEKEAQTEVGFRPLRDGVLIKRDLSEARTLGGVLIPDSSGQELPVIGTVIAVGKNTEEVNLNEIVLFGKYAGTEFKLDSGEYILMPEIEIMGVLT